MSLDFVKGVYVPVRDETRKVTSYGQMNKWHDFKTPLALNGRSNARHQPLQRGVELKLPTPEKNKIQNGKGPLEMPLFGFERSVTDAEARKSHHVRGRKYLSPISSNKEPVIANGRIIRPDPMSESAPVHLLYGNSSGYDDYHRTYMKLQKDGIYPSYPMYGPPRLHNGKSGGSWKHVKNVLQAKGTRTVFLDGLPRWIENDKIMNHEVPGTRDLYPIYKKKTSQAFTHPYKITQTTNFEKEAMRETERGNWNLMR